MNATKHTTIIISFYADGKEYNAYKSYVGETLDQFSSECDTFENELHEMHEDIEIIDVVDYQEDEPTNGIEIHEVIDED